MKLYCKNERPFVYAIFTDQDNERAISILQKIEEYGISLWFSDQFSKKEIRRIEAAYSCVLFISKNSIQDDKVRHCIEYAEKYNKKILCIYLEPTILSPGKELQLNSLQSINIDSFPDEQAFLEKLKSAEIFSDMLITAAQKRFAKRRGLASVFVPIASAVVIFVAVVVPLLIVPMVQAANGSLSKVGFGDLSLEELAKVEHLYVVSTRSFEQRYLALYKDTTKSDVYVNEIDLTIPKGDITDISDLALLKNAKDIAFEGNQVSDISPLFKIKTLERLTLNCNPIKSIQGIEVLQNLKEIYLLGTEINDISPLFKIPSLMGISFENTFVSSIEGIENLKHLMLLRTGKSNLKDISALKKIDFSYINSTDGFSFEAQKSCIKDFSPLQGIPKFNEIMTDTMQIMPYISDKQVYTLNIVGSDINAANQLSSIKSIKALSLKRSAQLASIEGMEVHTNLRELNLVDCTNLTDLAPLLKLPNLERLIICPDMEALASVQLAAATFEIICQECETDDNNQGTTNEADNHTYPPADGSLSKIGLGTLSLAELAKLDHLYVVGARSFEQWPFACYKDSKDAVIVDDLVIPKGDISDISDLALLKNAKGIAFEGNQVSDVSPLYKIKTLEHLTLNCNPINSIQGIESLQNLKAIHVAFTEVSDISPLFKIPSLTRISFENTYVSSIEGIENLKGLIELRTGHSNLTDISPLDKIDFSYINESDGFTLEAQFSLIKDFSPLQRIPKFNQIMVDSVPAEKILPYISNKQVFELHLGGSDISAISQLSSIKSIKSLNLRRNLEMTSIEGIENHTDLGEINLVDCVNLSDLTPLLKLQNLKRLVICQDMEALASTQLAGAAFQIIYLDCETDDNINREPTPEPGSDVYPPPDGSLNKIGFGNRSLAELAKVERLYVVGTRTFDRWPFAFYRGTQNTAYVNGYNIDVPKGNISDISDLTLLKNAKEIAFEANLVSDISPLYNIKTLEKLTLNCNPIKSIQGIEALQNLNDVTLVCTEVSDISPLFKIPSLYGISFENSPVSSIEGIENLKHLLNLRIGNSNVTDISPLNKINFSYVNDTEGFNFEAKQSLVKDFSPLQRIPKFNEIMVESMPVNLILPYVSNKQVSRLTVLGSDINAISQLSSIKNIQFLDLTRCSQLPSINGIENHTGIKELYLVHCDGLSDLTPLLKLPNLERLYISPGMEAMASAQLAGATFKIVYQEGY